MEAHLAVQLHLRHAAFDMFCADFGSTCSSTTLKAGEIGVVRGGNHAIANRSGRPAVEAVASHDAVAGE